MSAIIFHWTIEHNTPEVLRSPKVRKRILSRWNLMGKAFGINNFYCVTNDKGAKMGDSEVNFTSCETLEEAIKLTIQLGEHVFIEQGGTPLQDFNHPEHGVYVFGSDYGELITDNAVSIDSILPIHSEIAAGIVLASRYLQWH